MARLNKDVVKFTGGSVQLNPGGRYAEGGYEDALFWFVAYVGFETADEEIDVQANSKAHARRILHAAMERDYEPGLKVYRLELA